MASKITPHLFLQMCNALCSAIVTIKSSPSTQSQGNCCYFAMQLLQRSRPCIYLASPPSHIYCHDFWERWLNCCIDQWCSDLERLWRRLRGNLKKLVTDTAWVGPIVAHNVDVGANNLECAFDDNGWSLELKTKAFRPSKYSPSLSLSWQVG